MEGQMVGSHGVAPRLVSLTILLSQMASGVASAAEMAQPGGPFDGNWVTTILCPSSAGAKGYTYHFLSQVTGGVLHGQYGTPGRTPSLTVEGRINPDGTARLNASGLTGDPDYAVGHVRQGSPVAYHIAARFEGSRGTGSRLETRSCNVSFVRQ
jgi:hypothetical protein